MRGASEDVARSIEVQLRRAKGQVRRLNQNLEGIRFGSITGIRVQIRRVERMEQVLTALREGSAHSLLFQSALPIEEALDEIFKRYAGGRGGGQRKPRHQRHDPARAPVAQVPGRMVDAIARRLHRLIDGGARLFADKRGVR